MKYQKILILLVTSIIFASCSNWDSMGDNEDCEDPDYLNCDTREPITAKMKIRITVNEQNQKVPVKIYYGNFEENKLFAEFDTAVTDFEYEMPVGDKFSLTAKYYSGNDSILAIDGIEITKKSTKNCDSICWTLKNDDADLRLVY